MDGSILKCGLCHEICKKGAQMKCCGTRACRACAFKKITSSRTCWSCAKTGLSTTEDLENDDVLRKSVEHFNQHKILLPDHITELTKNNKQIVKKELTDSDKIELAEKLKVEHFNDLKTLLPDHKIKKKLKEGEQIEPPGITVEHFNDNKTLLPDHKIKKELKEGEQIEHLGLKVEHFNDHKTLLPHHKIKEELKEGEQFEPPGPKYQSILAILNEAKMNKKNPKQVEVENRVIKELYKTLDHSNKGFAMLSKMGYKPGDGLGKSGTGSLEPIGIQEYQVKMGNLNVTSKLFKTALLPLTKRQAHRQLMKEQKERKKERIESRVNIQEYQVKIGNLQRDNKKELTEVEQTESTVNLNVTSKLFKTAPILPLTKEQKMKWKRPKQAEVENRVKGLSKTLDSSNKGFAMLAKMGYQPGDGLGKSGTGRLEPVGIQVKMGRSGLGLDTEKSCISDLPQCSNENEKLQKCLNEGSIDEKLQKCLNEGSIIEDKITNYSLFKKQKRYTYKYYCKHCKGGYFYNYKKHFKNNSHTDHVLQCNDFKSCFQGVKLPANRKLGKFYNLRKSDFIAGLEIREWAIVCFVPSSTVSQEALLRFSNQLQKTCNDEGMTIKKHPFSCQYATAPEQVEPMFRNLKATFTELQLVVVVIPDSNPIVDLYSEVKRVGDTVLGIPTQCVKANNVNTPDRALSNLCLKINAKLAEPCEDNFSEKNIVETSCEENFETFLKSGSAIPPL